MNARQRRKAKRAGRPVPKRQPDIDFYPWLDPDDIEGRLREMERDMRSASEYMERASRAEVASTGAWVADLLAIARSKSIG